MYLLSCWCLLFPYLSNCGNSERIITHNEELLKTVTHEQDFNGKKIKTWVYKATESQSHNDLKMCYDDTHHLAYVFSSRIYTNRTHLSLYMIELQNHNISLLLHGDNTHTGMLKHVICKSGVLIHVYHGDIGIWSRFHDDRNMFFDHVGTVEEVLMSDYNPDDLALLTEDNKVRHVINCSYITWINQKKNG
ncbi:hypothetical protein RF11_03803 [Thelohanellus kitauei]|uniref:Uncharacterized protein n=1 Tax=Thelohanellus kitauei TaxID=669202 RepID=A0A0C2N4R0_THEKT|nr:hypothetical protein RF11_03803 [Thelohanellus kitauei]